MYQPFMMKFNINIGHAFGDTCAHSLVALPGLSPNPFYLLNQLSCFYETLATYVGFEPLVETQWTTWRNIPEDDTLLAT
jgi:hypothetical protein